MEEGNTVEFETVTKRFGEATAALENLSQLLQGLKNAREVQEKAATTISQASDSLRITSDNIASFCDALRSTLDLTLEALQSAENLATGTELTTIRTGVDGVKEIVVCLVEQRETLDVKLTELAGGQRSISETLHAIRNRIDVDLSAALQLRDSARSELAETKERLGRLEGHLAGLPAKVRRKYNLEEGT